MESNEIGKYIGKDRYKLIEKININKSWYLVIVKG